MTSLLDRAIAAVAGHPAVTRVEPAGSRSRGTQDELSDWDVAVETSDFETFARDLPGLVAPLEPLAALWEPLGRFPVYSLVLRGPAVVEYLFLGRVQDPSPPVRPSPETLTSIDVHFWHWLWWLATKASVGRDDLLAQHWPVMYRHLLEPLAVAAVPDGIEVARREFQRRRDELERRYGIEVPRALEDEVRSGIRRLGLE